MNTIPHEEELTSRWRLEGSIPLARLAEGASWHRARDQRSGDPVVLFVVTGPMALETADAARRAALVEDAHLLPVLDVAVLGETRETGAKGSGGPTAVVVYPMPSAPPLAALFARQKSLRPETARSVIGEAAQGLEAARRRGVRHQFLDSNRIFVDTRSGAVTLLGIGVEAASHAGLDRSGDVASFQDTASLTALLYRAIAGRSARRGEDGLVPRMSTIAKRSVPTDLDALCDLVLNETEGDFPETTRELLQELGPWQSIPVTLEAHDAEDPSTPAPARAATPEPVRTVTEEASSSEEEAPQGALEERPEATADGASSAGPVLGAAATATAVAGAAAGSASARAPQEGPRETIAEKATAPAAKDDAADAEPRSSEDDETVAGPEDPQADPPAQADEPQQTQESEDTKDPERAQESESAPERSEAVLARERAEAERRHHSEQAQGLVDDLRLNEKRSDAAFPGHLDIQRPVVEEPAEADDVEAQGAPDDDSKDGSTGSGAAAALGGGAVAGAAVAGASAAPSESTPDAEVSEPEDAGGPTPEQAPTEDTDSLDDAVVADPSAEEPSQQDSGPVPVLVPGRSEPVAPGSGPIVVPGRDRISDVDGDAEAWSTPVSQQERTSLLRDVVGVATDRDETGSTFMMGPEDAEERSRQSQWILAGAVLFVIIAMVFAVTSITSGLRERVTNPLGTTAPAAAPPSPEEEPSEEPTEEATEEPTEEPTEEALPAPELTGVEIYDNGSSNGPDNADQAPRMLDGDPETFWSTQYYANPIFGGLKEGLGVRVSFAEKGTITSVTLRTARNVGGTLELRPVDDAGEVGEPIATGAFNGDGDVELTPEEPVEATGMVLWITELAPDSIESGKFRGRIAEITVE